MRPMHLRLLALPLLMLTASLVSVPARAAQTILNVSYDPTREFYEEYDATFANHWKAKTGQD